MQLLEESGSDLSLRAVARRAGVSTAAPYRHFADRDALLSAVAAVGYRELAETLTQAQPAPASLDDLGTIAVAYVRFALDRPALFRVMFAEPCDPTNPERVAAVAAITEYLESIVHRVAPEVDATAMATGMWALVHGLAFLHLDGKFGTAESDVEDRVRAAVNAVSTYRLS